MSVRRGQARRVRSQAMRTAIRQTETNGPVHDARDANRRARVVIRRVDPWSVLKVSFVIYLCVMLVLVIAAMLVYFVLGVTGVLDGIGEWMQNFSLAEAGFEFNGFWIFSRLLAFGAANVIVWSFVNLMGAILYNLVADVVGGIQITLGERK
jgi:hypothetical protein